MNQAELKAHIQTSLGGNLIDVELVDDDFAFAFDQAKNVFIQKGNNNMDKKYYSLDVVTDQTLYTLPSEENIDTVIDLIKTNSVMNTSDPFSMSSFQQMFGDIHRSGSGLGLLSYELTLQMLENINFYTASDTQFIYKKRNNTLRLLDVPKKDDVWILECYADLSDDEYRDVFWIREWARAECKGILGRALRKFSSLSTPTGETSLDGEAMVAEAQEEKAALLEDIANYVDGDTTGGIIMIG